MIYKRILIVKGPGVRGEGHGDFEVRFDVSTRSTQRKLNELRGRRGRSLSLSKGRGRGQCGIVGVRIDPSTRSRHRKLRDGGGDRTRTPPSSKEHSLPLVSEPVEGGGGGLKPAPDLIRGRGLPRRHLPGPVSLINRAETGYMGRVDRMATDAAAARLERRLAGRKTG